MLRRSSYALLVLSLLTSVATSHAQNDPIGFQSPSKNIGCQFFTDDKQNWLRCDIVEMATTPRRPADCEFSWGQAFEVSSKGEAGRVCNNVTVINDSLPVLAYGDVWQRGGFTCRSEQTGLTCFNAMQRGFSLS